MLIHIFSASPHHYIPMREFFIKAGKGIEQQFWIPVGASHCKHGFVEFADNKALLVQLAAMKSNTRFVFHGVFDPTLIRALLRFKRLAHSACMIWGAELYRYEHKLSLKGLVNRFIHSQVLKKFGCVFTLNQGDSNLLTQRLAVKHAHVLPYPLIGFAQTNTKKRSDRIKLLLGNSGAPSNNHIEMLQKLAAIRDLECQIVVPLNYGAEQDYIKSVIAVGKKLFSDNFIALTSMLDKTSYDELLNEVDLLVFAHNRQQGLYAVYAMLQMGKPVFLNSNTTSYRDLSSLGFKLYDSSSLQNLGGDGLNCLVQKINTQNQGLMQRNFSEHALLPKWREMFVDLLK